jgi:heme/copper-type cytochrome/quinol oxidase subunit 1
MSCGIRVNFTYGLISWRWLGLCVPVVQLTPDNQLYNSIITAHAILMIFFLVMPAMIGGFGDFFIATINRWSRYGISKIKKK